ncbi:hypothetical protein K030075H31_52720 [Blautia producta]
MYIGNVDTEWGTAPYFVIKEMEKNDKRLYNKGGRINKFCVKDGYNASSV